MAALIIASVPLSETFADHGEHHEGWKGESEAKYDHFDEDDHDDDEEWEEDEWEEDDDLKTPMLIPSEGAHFTDGETVTLSFSEGVNVKAVVKVKNGHLLVPAQPVFDAHKIPYILYPKGNILEGFANGKQFIFHAGKRVMYLGGQKKGKSFWRR